MSDPNVVTQTPSQPDADAMAAIMAKIARVKRILGFLAYSQAVISPGFPGPPFLPASLGLSAYAFGFMLAAPFLLGLAYAANFAKKILHSLRWHSVIQPLLRWAFSSSSVRLFNSSFSSHSDPGSHCSHSRWLGLLGNLSGFKTIVDHV